MKKILLIISVVALAIPMMYGVSFGDATIGAATTMDSIQDTGHPGCNISLSKNVSFGYNVDSVFQSYAIQSYHISGNKAYGTASDTTLIYWQEDETNDDVGAPSAENSSMCNTGWTSM